MPPENYYPRWDDLYFQWGVETRTKAVVQSELEHALEIEDYERAAVLRDELKAM